MVVELDQRVQRERYFAIVDEVDNILIDEARTPLIISGQAEESADQYFQFARLVPRLRARPEGDEEGGDYFVDLKEQAVSPTEEGIAKIEQPARRRRTSTTPTRTLARYFEQALRPTPSTSATATTSSRTARSSSSTSSPAARCRPALDARACTRRSRPRRACASSASA